MSLTQCKLTGEELQITVYLNVENARHTIAVVDEDQKFPFLKRKSATSVTLVTDAEGFIDSFGFKWIAGKSLESVADTDLKQPQTVGARAGVMYRFAVSPGVPLDILLVPETNHLDLELNLSDGVIHESSDNNRNVENITQTEGGQVEWTQFAPTQNTMEVIVSDKSGFGGNFRLVVRPLNRIGNSLRPTSFRLLEPTELNSLLEAFLSRLPMISDSVAVVYEFTPVRTVDDYRFEVSAVNPDLNFGLVVKSDKAKPPLFIHAGGTDGRSASFSWTFREGELYINGKKVVPSGEYPGFPVFGKIQVSVVAFGGSGRIKAALSESTTLRNLDVPVPKAESRITVMYALGAAFEGFQFIDNALKVYRFTAEAGKSYKMRIVPQQFLDIAIIDSSKRSDEYPTALELVDKAGAGGPEELEIVANREFVEFGVISVRYAGGVVRPENKRIGGIGHYSYQMSGDDKKPADELELLLVDLMEVTLPNEIVSDELGLRFEPWDYYSKRIASDFPPFSVKTDSRILDALANPLDPVR